MQKNAPTTEQGFIKLIILVVIGLLILRFFFEFDVIDYVGQEEFKTFARGVWNMIIIGWTFIINGIVFAWEIGKDLVLKAFEISKGWLK